MRIAVLSDLHAHVAALEAVLADAARSGADDYLVLGDIVDLGPEPAAVVERVRALGCPVVRGNHDPLDERSPVPALEAMREWTHARLSTEQSTWLEALPDSHDLTVHGCRIRAVHASPGSLTHPILPTTTDAELASLVAAEPIDVLCCGHTHLQLVRRVGATTIVNAGSVALPFAAPVSEGPPRVFPWAEYAMLDVEVGRFSVELRRVTYDFARYERAFRACGFADAAFFLGAWDHATARVLGA